MQRLDSTKIFCSAAWTDLNIDFGKRTKTHCCKAKKETFPDTIPMEFWNESDMILDRREKLVEKVPHGDCSYCWIDYSKTGFAYRDIKNKWGNILPYGNNHLEYIEINLDNICDMSCLYCSAMCSSQIAAEEGVLDKRREFVKEEDFDSFMTFLENTLSKTKKQITINFMGGEPTLSPYFFKIIYKLHEKFSRKKINLSLLTNGNSNEKTMQKMKDVLDFVNNWDWHIGLSQEATGEVAELTRWGCKWETWQKNYEFYLFHKSVKLLILAPTPNRLSLHDLPNFVDYITESIRRVNPKKEIAWAGNWVSDPKVLDIAHLDESNKKYVKRAKKKLSRHKKNIQDWDDTMKWIDTLEKRIGTMSPDYKELNEFIDNKAKNKKTTRLERFKHG